MSLLQEGQIIRGTYEVERFLGEGAFAEVYRVRHRFLGRQALKIFKMSGMTVKEIEELLEEAALLSRIGHPNIVRVFDANTLETPQGTLGFFTMEYVAGGSLEKFWRSHGVQFVPIETTVELMRQVCRGLAVAHTEDPPLIHRDIKPQNILVGYDACGLRVRIADFGLAKRVNPMTLMASGRGTLAFKAPEVFRDFNSDSCTGDVWALGSTMYLLMTDRLPFAQADEFDLLDSTCFERPLIPPSRLNVQADPMLDQVVSKALAIKPQGRYPTANELLSDLERWNPTRPDKSSSSGSSSSSDSLKGALGAHSPADMREARKMLAQAKKLSHEVGKLTEAADLLEEAFNKWPGLRDDYGNQLQLWRRGIIM